MQDVNSRPYREEESACCVIIPTFNEGRSVAAVVAAAHVAMPSATIVVVNDGSTDDSAERAINAGAVVLSLPFNVGIGGAVQTGYRFALRQGFTYAMQIDGDGQHDPAEATRLLEPLISGTADMVVGSRWLGRGEYEATSQRRIGMKILARLVQWRTGTPLTDTTSGFRAVGRSGIELFAERYPTDFPEVETLVLATRHGLRIAEVPVIMAPRRHGHSSIAGLNSAYYMIRVVTLLLLEVLDRKEAT
jgi:glycosyltransferase involved in cell wall biosynthesis